jgi:hypothetical protein
MSISILWGNVVFEYLTSAAILVQFAFLFYSLGFLARDELWLRGFLLVGTIFYLLYYYFIEAEPLWEAIFTSGVLGAINLCMIVVLIFERTTFAMDEQTEKAFQSFDTLTPGQFRKVIKLAKTVTVHKDTKLSVEHTPIEHLYLVTDGAASLSKSGTVTELAAPLFLGEVGFLLEGKASATVIVKNGGTFTYWDANALRKLMNTSPAINNAIIALLSRDLASKLGRSSPIENA